MKVHFVNMVYFAKNEKKKKKLQAFDYLGSFQFCIHRRKSPILLTFYNSNVQHGT